jgi:hypothetical protein
MPKDRNRQTVDNDIHPLFPCPIEIDPVDPSQDVDAPRRPTW